MDYYFSFFRKIVHSTCKWIKTCKPFEIFSCSYLSLTLVIINVPFLSFPLFILSLSLSFFPSSHPLVLSLSPFLVASIPSCFSFYSISFSLPHYRMRCAIVMFATKLLKDLKRNIFSHCNATPRLTL